MGNLFTARVGNILTALLGNILTVGVGKVLDIYTAGEGMQGSAQEAMACVLAEVSEDGVNGMLVHNQTPEGLADSIILLLLDRQRREAMGRAARKRVEDFFDVRRAARETIGIYKELLGE